MTKLRMYTGSSIFVIFLSLSIAAECILIAYPFSQSYVNYFFPLISAASLVVLSLLYLVRFTPLQKHFARVTGEMYLLAILTSLVILAYACIEVLPTFSSSFDARQFLELLLRRISSLGLFNRVTFLLLILVYHFLVNKRTVEDLNIKDITHDIEYVVVAAIGLFCLFGLINFSDLIEEGTFHLPSFENLVNFFLVILAEEIMYRYYIQGAASEAFSKYRALFIASLLFALAHFGRPFGMYHIHVFISSLVFGYGYMRNQNLAVPLILHGLTLLFPMVLL